MYVVMTSSLDSAKLGATFSFNAKNSNVVFADNSSLSCSGTNFCNFTWQVTREGKPVGKPVESRDGTFSFKPGAKGKYLVAVTVCRGDVCGDDGVLIEAK